MDFLRSEPSNQDEGKVTDKKNNIKRNNFWLRKFGINKGRTTVTTVYIICYKSR